MAKEAGKKSFLDFFKVKELDDDDEFDDDLFDDDDDDDDYESPREKKSKTNFSKNNAADKAITSSYRNNSSYSQAATQSDKSTTQSYSSQKPQARSNNKVVDINKQQRASFRGGNEVRVIKPQDISESQTVADFLKAGRPIVINMEGLELEFAQRIIDFIGGACYALDGSLKAVTANIFIAAPESVEVSGDLREEILNDATVSPQLGRY